MLAPSETIICIDGELNNRTIKFLYNTRNLDTLKDH
jgi:hypothetical protein